MDHRVAAMDSDVVAGFESDRTVSTCLYAGVETDWDGAKDSDLSLLMVIDSARLETVSLDVGAVADSDGVPSLSSDLAAVFASGRTVVLDLDGVEVMD